MNTMYVYWGGSDSGKAHLKHYAIHNNKTQLLWDTRNKRILKMYSIVHYQGDYWRDETVSKIIYHNIDGFRKCEKKSHSIYHHKQYEHNKSSINAKTSMSNYRQVRNKRNYSKDDIKKYSQIEYINTNLYFDIISKYITEIGEDIPREMLDYGEIFKDVDLVSIIPPEYVIEDNVELFQSSINIIPYKSNILDSIISKLDLYTNAFLEGLEDERDDDLLEVYNSDKNIIWNYLDEFDKQQDNVIDLLKKYNIPYQMFDLDNDSYKDTFGWEIELPRNYTHRKDSWQNNDRYAIIQDIAKEYVQR